MQESLQTSDQANNHMSFRDSMEQITAENAGQAESLSMSTRDIVDTLSEEREQLISELQVHGHSADLRGRLDDVNNKLLGARANLIGQEGTAGANPDDR